MEWGVASHLTGSLVSPEGQSFPLPIKVPPEKRCVFCGCCGQKSLIMQRLFLKNAMEYVGFLCDFMWSNCGNLLKLQELAKLAKSCENCGSW